MRSKFKNTLEVKKKLRIHSTALKMLVGNTGIVALKFQYRLVLKLVILTTLTVTNLFVFFFPEFPSTMAGKTSSKLLVILSPDDSRMLLLPNGIPESVEKLIDNVKKVCGINGKIRLQHQDRDFGHDLSIRHKPENLIILAL